MMKKLKIILATLAIFTTSPLIVLAAVGDMVTYNVTSVVYPSDIAFDGTNMWVSSNINGFRTAKISPTGVTTSYLSMSNGGLPVGISFDRTNMWIAGYTADSITKVSPTGVMVDYYGTGAGPWDIAFDGTNMWTVNDGYYDYIDPYDGMSYQGYGPSSVTKITPSGAMTTYYGTGYIAEGIAFDGVNMWVANFGDNSVTKISPTGAMTTYTGTGSSPYQLAFDGTNMWTANYGGNSVTKISPTGTMTTYTGTGVGPCGIAFDGTNMWTGNYSGNSVTKISPTGAMTTYTGTGANPCNIAFDGANMWTANLSDNTVTKIVASLPTGTVSVSSNISSSWTITGPATITGSGTSQTSASKPVGTYTITWGAVAGYATPASQSLTLTSGGTISFSGNYSLNSYTVSASAGAGGTISPASRTISYGSTTTFTVTPNAGYTASATGCGGSLVGTTYTTGAITGACTVSATYSVNSYAVSASAGAGGTISPASRTISYGSTTTFTVTPNAGYTASATGCGGSLVGTTYTTGAITGACTVSATFAASTASPTASISTPTTDTSVTQNTTVVFSGSGTPIPSTSIPATLTTVNAGSVQNYANMAGPSVIESLCQTGGYSSGYLVAIQHSPGQIDSLWHFTYQCTNNTYSCPVDYTLSGTNCIFQPLITSYEWREGNCSTGTLLSSASSFNLSTPTTGTRTVYFRVKDSQGTWSTNCPSIVVTVTSPTAVPTVTTPTVTSITTSGATLGANITSLGNPATITARGTCWGTTANPTTNCVAATGTTTGTFTHTRTGMAANTTYYYRGYATNSTGTGYSADGTFTTNMNTPTAPTISGPTTLKAGDIGTYSFVSTDPQGQQISYAVDWNSDGTDLWMPYGSLPPQGSMTYVNSGVSQSASNSWSTPGTYTVRVLAQNKIGGLNSAWTTYTITVTCSNNTINPPTCTQCGDNIAYVNGFCVFCSTGGCSGTGGNSTNGNSTLTCNSGAINIPSCNLCPGGQTLVGSTCVNNCTNGATNPTTCDACPAGQELIGGICTVVTTCGDNTCNGSENILTCPADCKGKYQQF